MLFVFSDNNRYYTVGRPTCQITRSPSLVLLVILSTG